MSVRFLASGDAALVVEFGDRIAPALSDRVLRLDALVRAAKPAGMVETVPTIRSLTVHYDPLATDHATIVSDIRKLLGDVSSAPRQAKLWRIPACYADAFAPDLAEVAERTGLTADEIVRVHSGMHFHVYMLGFSPGFPYMGDLPESLRLPRRADPRVRVPQGSIAIAGAMTSIYPVESPGGWHLIGATPVRLFDVGRQRPALLSAGDRVSFEPVTPAEFDRIRAAVAADGYEVPCEAAAP
jgi:KipI family sensor histidine kinase inhibitor